MELKKLNTFDISYFRGKNYFEEDGTQNWFVLQPMGKYLEISYTNNTAYILSWKSKGLSDLEIKPIKTNNFLLNSRIDQYHASKVRLKFNGSILNRSPPSIIHSKIVNIYIVYEITNNYNDSSYPTVEDCLFGSVKLTKNTNIDKYEYSGYGIGFDRRASFLIGNDIGRNVIIFGVDMSSSLLIGNKKKGILILDKEFTLGLEHAISAEKMYSINFTKKNTKFCLSLHYNGANSYLFVNRTEIIKFKAKDSEIKGYSLCLGNISKDWSNDNMKKTGFNGYIYDFGTDYSAIDVDNIKDIHKYLMKKNGIV